jgi:dihydrofolate reductase
MNKRKMILNIAMSLDGFISDENGWFDWIIGDWDKSIDTDKKMDFNDFLSWIDTVIMWKKAYDDCPGETLDMLKDKKIYVATHSELKNKQNNVICINWDLSQHISKEQELPWKDIYLWWGAIVTDSFIKSDVIDEYIIGIIPTILWKGRPLFLEDNPIIKLHLVENINQEWIVILKYKKRI